MIEVQSLSKSYRNFMAIRDVSFHIKKGEIVGFLGPNGAGKSTTMKILTGFIPSTHGFAKIDGFDVFEQPREVKKRIGYLPEFAPLYPELTVQEYLTFVARIKGIPRSEIKQCVDKVLQRVSLNDVFKRLIRNLSKGYQQRTALAQALLGNPDVLILDEPTIGMDPRQIGEVRSLIKELAAEHTVILSSHILQEITGICQRIIIINQGRIVADDTLHNLVKKYSPEHEPASLEKVFLNLTEV